MHKILSQQAKSKNISSVRLFSNYTNKYYLDKDSKYLAPNYAPNSPCIERGQGIYVWDVEGRRYFDFLNGYSSNNLGHSHPKLVKALVTQAQKITQIGRCFSSDQIGATAEYLTKLFGYDKMLPMNSGVEACETAVKIARKWGYLKKGIPDNKAHVIVMEGNYWGKTITAAGACDDPQRYTHFGPFTAGFDLCPYNNATALQHMLEKNPNVCAVLLEPIQGERGVVVPSQKYLSEVRALCTKHNVAMIVDEIQSGLGRTGKLFAYNWDKIRPDMITLGKALSGGMMPVSAVFCDDKFMSVLNNGDHGSTFGGNPLGMAVTRAAIEILMEEGLVENSLRMGDIWADELSKIKSPLVKETRGRGLWRGIEIVNDANVEGSDLEQIYKDMGLLTKTTKNYVVRFAPALTIKESELREACKILSKGIEKLEEVNKERSTEKKKIRA